MALNDLAPRSGWQKSEKSLVIDEFLYKLSFYSNLWIILFLFNCKA